MAVSAVGEAPLVGSTSPDLDFLAVGQSGGGRDHHLLTLGEALADHGDFVVGQPVVDFPFFDLALLDHINDGRPHLVIFLIKGRTGDDQARSGRAQGQANSSEHPRLDQSLLVVDLDPDVELATGRVDSGVLGEHVGGELPAAQAVHRDLALFAFFHVAIDLLGEGRDDPNFSTRLHGQEHTADAGHRSRIELSIADEAVHGRL